MIVACCVCKCLVCLPVQWPFVCTFDMLRLDLLSHWKSSKYFQQLECHKSPCVFIYLRLLWNLNALRGLEELLKALGMNGNNIFILSLIISVCFKSFILRTYFLFSFLLSLFPQNLQHFKNVITFSLLTKCYTKCKWFGLFTVIFFDLKCDFIFGTNFPQAQITVFTPIVSYDCTQCTMVQMTQYPANTHCLL